MPTPQTYILLVGTGGAVSGAATLRLTATADLKIPAALASATSILRVTATANLSVGNTLGAIATLALTASASLTAGPPAQLAGTATLSLTGSGDVRVPAALAGTATLRITTGLALLGPSYLSGHATLRITARLIHGILLDNGSATLRITATADLTPSRAVLTGRARLVIAAAGALSVGRDLELRALRSEDVQRPVGHVEAIDPAGAPLNVLRFHLDSSLDTPADGWTAEVAGAALMLAPNDAALYRLSMGFLNASDEEVLAAQIASGRILDRRLVGRATERRTYLRGLDALERTFRIQRRVRYVPENEDGHVLVLDSVTMQLQETLSEKMAAKQVIESDPSFPTPELSAQATAINRIILNTEQGLTASKAAEVPEKVGVWTASGIAADLAVGTGLTVSWECRDYTFAEPFDAVGTFYDLLQRLAEPWNQVKPFGVDITAMGSVVRVRARLLHPPADLTQSIAASRLVELELGDRRRLPLLGLVQLEGRIEAAGSSLYSGESAPGIGEPVLPVLPWESVEDFADDTTDLSGNVIGRVEGRRTYRMPDRLLIAWEERVWGRSPDGRFTIVKAETGTATYEDSHYGPNGPLNQPLPLASERLLDTLLPPTEDGGLMVLGRTSEERVRWEYDDRTFLRATYREVYKRHESEGLVSFPLAETVIETRETALEGWVKLKVTRATYDPVTGEVTGSVSEAPQDQAGFPPGGPRMPFSFSTFISAPVREGHEVGASTPVRLVETISTDPTAVPLSYSNPNLSRADLEFIMSQCREASGLVEYPLRGRGPALPDVIKGSAIHLTDYLDADGVTPIPLDAALVRSIAFDYRDTREGSAFECALDAVFYRSA